MDTAAKTLYGLSRIQTGLVQTDAILICIKIKVDLSKDGDEPTRKFLILAHCLPVNNLFCLNVKGGRKCCVFRVFLCHFTSPLPFTSLGLDISIDIVSKEDNIRKEDAFSQGLKVL